MRREYGMTKTHLSLTSKAEKYYSGATPFDIFEYEVDGPLDEDGYPEGVEYRYTYKAFGDPESRMMTEDELNAELEAMQDELEAWERENG